MIEPGEWKRVAQLLAWLNFANIDPKNANLIHALLREMEKIWPIKKETQE